MPVGAEVTIFGQIQGRSLGFEELPQPRPEYEMRNIQAGQYPADKLGRLLPVPLTDLGVGVDSLVPIYVLDLEAGRAVTVPYRVRDPDPIRVRFRAWARNRTRMSEEGRLAGRFPRDESRGYDWV